MNRAPEKKSLRNFLVAFGYVLIAVAVVGGTAILVAYGQGYSYDLRKNRFVSKGLVLIGSVPSGASINIDGKDTGKRTPWRPTLEVGDYTFKLSKSGYYDWSKRLKVVRPEVTWAQYAWLFPKNPKQQSIFNDVSGVQLVTGSQTQKRFAYLQGSAVWTFDSTSKQPVKLYTAKPASALKPAEEIKQLAWSYDESSLLIKSQVGPDTQYILVSGTDLQNLSEIFKYKFNDLKFNPTNSKQMYWVDNGGLRLLDVSSRTISAVLLDNVMSFTLVGDRIFYVQMTDLGPGLWSLDKAGVKQEISQSVAASDAYEMAYSNTGGKDRLIVLPTKAHTITLYSDIFSSRPVSKVLSRSADHLAGGVNNRYFGFYGTSELGSFSLEDGTLTSTPSAGVIGADWLDDYHFLINWQGTYGAADFDGQNQVKIGETFGWPAFLLGDKRVLLIKAAVDKTIFTAISLR